ncbi:MAG: hypothetical protein HDT48_08105 [Ruminococcaceae bacterium]|nr:hypothetical protein [Oscillospiraceae bacterium]
MLRRLEQNEFESYAQYAYKLALNMSCSSYPTYADGIKTREDFIEKSKRGISGDLNTEILLFESKGSVKGWIHYYVQPEDKYLSFYSFCIEENTSEAVSEFLSYAGEKYSGYTVNLGLPDANKEAAKALTESGFENIENSHVNVLSFENYSCREEKGNICAVDKENFHLFKRLHDPVSADMYWNSGRLKEKYFSDEKKWHLYLSMNGENAEGCVYFVFAGNIMEIFGIDFVNGVFDKEIMRDLFIKSLNVSKMSGSIKYMYFFTDSDEEQEIVTEAGMKHIGDYKLFRGRSVDRQRKILSGLSYE